MSFDVNIVQAYEMKKNTADGIWCGVYEIYAISSVLYEYNLKIIRWNVVISVIQTVNLYVFGHTVEHFQSITLPGIYIQVHVLIFHILWAVFHLTFYFK